ncbi:MAG: hypothetical protein HYV07_10710 [Deltaproteobacteria bacterium]|nr:hypothetical protein [Deltaproteobacteria bacterium]
MDLRALKDTPPWEWPENTDTRLLELLRDERTSDSDLCLAVELAGDYTVINDALADALLAIIRAHGKSDQIRCTAAISLGPALEHAYDFDDLDDFDDVTISQSEFRRIQESLWKLYLDADVPKDVRRRILEASVRAPEDWHADAIRAAYSSKDEDWRLTAVFGMRHVRGFETQILDALKSDNEDIHFEAVVAAGAWELDSAWPHVADLISLETEKALLLAAIDAVASIRPDEASELLAELGDAEDEDIVAAAEEAAAMAAAMADATRGDEDLDEEDDDEILS